MHVAQCVLQPARHSMLQCATELLCNVHQSSGWTPTLSKCVSVRLLDVQTSRPPHHECRLMNLENASFVPEENESTWKEHLRRSWACQVDCDTEGKYQEVSLL